MADQAPVSTADRDWTVEVTDKIETVVGAVRDKTTEPVLNVADTAAFGLVAALLGFLAFILFVVAILRLLYVYIPIHPVSRRVWIVDAGVSAIMLAVGAFLWRRRNPRPLEE
jgi:hypothetical protein